MFKSAVGSGRYKFLLVTFLVWCSANVPTALADEISDAKKSTSSFFKDKSFTAKIDLQTTGKYNVDPDGQPTEDRTQGRIKKRTGIGQRDVAFAVGNSGRGIYVSVSKRKKRIKVTLQAKRGPTMHAVSLYIHFDRKLEADDIDPRAIAYALAAYVDFEGLEAGSEIEAALETLHANDEAPLKDTTSERPLNSPALASLVASAMPVKVKAGSSVALNLTFEISATGNQKVIATETRTLMFNGSILPSYPRVHEDSRATGSHTSRFKQPIPRSAKPGIYRFTGEVCVQGDCISRNVSFEVIR